MSQNAPVWTGQWSVRPDRNRQVRIGDAERDQAVSELTDHFVAGRLTQKEYDERSDLAIRARYAADLPPLFDDLPDPAAVPAPGRPWSPRARAWSPGVRRGLPPFAWLAPVLFVAFIATVVVTAVVLTVPWFVWVLFWVFLFSGPHRGRRRHHHGGYRYR